MHKETGTRIVKQFLQLEEVRKIFDIFAKHEIRLVGGCVRDALLCRSYHDIDFATILLPEQVMERLAANQIKSFATGIKFGTITALVNGKNFEITTLRVDENCDGRFAEVKYTNDWEEDAKRRDFTINALSLTSNGQLYDYFDGIADLKNHQLRFIGNAESRISEDYLRILRFFRFTAYYGMTPIDPLGLSACRLNASNLQKLSGERICAELLKILASDKAAEVLAVMAESQILEYILPNLSTDFLALLKLIKLEASTQRSPLRRLALLIKQSPQVKLVDLAKSLRLSLAQAKYIELLCFEQKTLTEPLLKEKIRTMGREHSTDLLLIESAMTESEDITHFSALLDLIKQWKPPIFPLKGEDLLSVGIAGKEMGIVLNQLKKYWAENNYSPNKQELLKEASPRLGLG